MKGIFLILLAVAVLVVLFAIETVYFFASGGGIVGVAIGLCLLIWRMIVSKD